MKINNQKGFSIVELMVVIGIIAILASTAIAMYSNHSTKAKIASVLHSLGGVKANVSDIASTSGELSGINSSDNTVTEVPSEDSDSLKYTTSVSDGIITSTITYPVNGTVVLTPQLDSGSIVWTCTSNLNSSEIPTGCSETGSETSNSSIVTGPYTTSDESDRERLLIDYNTWYFTTQEPRNLDFNDFQYLDDSLVGPDRLHFRNLDTGLYQVADSPLSGALSESQADFVTTNAALSDFQNSGYFESQHLA